MKGARTHAVEDVPPASPAHVHQSAGSEIGHQSILAKILFHLIHH